MCVCVCVCVCVRARLRVLALVLSMPDTVEEMCPELPHLDGLLKNIHDLSETGARYTEMPQVCIVWML